MEIGKIKRKWNFKKLIALEVIILIVLLGILAYFFVFNQNKEMTIGQIHKNAENLMGKELITSGRVIRSTKIFTYAAFLIEDSNGENSIWVEVAPDSIMPKEGMKMWIRGILIKGISLEGYRIQALEVAEI